MRTHHAPIHSHALALRAVLLLILVALLALALGDWHPLHLSALQTGIATGGGALALATGPFAGILPDALASREKRPYFIPLNWVPIAAGQTLPVLVVGDANQDFVCHRIVYTARDAATGAIVDRPLLTISMSKEGGEFFNPAEGGAVELENLAGRTGGSPELVIPLIIAAGDKLTASLTNGTAVALHVRATLIGFRSSRRSA